MKQFDESGCELDASRRWSLSGPPVRVLSRHFAHRVLADGERGKKHATPVSIPALTGGVCDLNIVARSVRLCCARWSRSACPTEIGELDAGQSREGDRGAINDMRQRGSHERNARELPVLRQGWLRRWITENMKATQTPNIT